MLSALLLDNLSNQWNSDNLINTKSKEYYKNMSQKSTRSAKYTRTSRNVGHDSENVFLFEPETNYPRKDTIKIKKTLILIGILATVSTIVSIIAIISSQIEPIDITSNESNCPKFTANSSAFSLKQSSILHFTLLISS